MDRRVIKPWAWQDQFGFVQANEIAGAQRVLLCAGQTSVDADSRPVHAGDMRAQLAQVLDNLEAVLRTADLTLAQVVRLNYYTTDVEAFLAAGDVLGARASSPAGSS